MQSADATLFGARYFTDKRQHTIFIAVYMNSLCLGLARTVIYERVYLTIPTSLQL